MTELEKLQADLLAEREKNAKLDAEKKSYSQVQADKDAEIAQLKADKAVSDKAAADAVLKAEETRREAYVNQMVAEKVITPAMKPFVAALLGDEKKEYSVKSEADKEAKAFSKEDLFKQILKLHSATGVNRTEGSEDGKETETKNSDDAINDKIEQYMTENKCSYKQAYSAVTKVHKPRASRSLASVAQADA